MRRLPLLCAVLVALVLAAVCVRLWRVNTSIVEFLPAGDDRELFAVSKALANSGLTRRMVISLGPAPGLDGADPEVRREVAGAAEKLAAGLARSPRVASVRRDVTQDAERALFEIYFPRRYHFWSKAPEREIPEALSDANLGRAAEALKEALGGPEGPLARRLAPEDPLQRFRAFLRGLEAARPSGVESALGQLFSKEGHALLFVDLADSPFDGERQRELLDALDELRSELPRVGGEPLVLETSGVNRFALAGEEVAKRDLNRITVLSLGGLLLLFGGLMRRPGRLLFTFTPLAGGVLVAMATSLVLFGELHVLALAFGSALLGVAIDYPVHLVHHHDLGASGESPDATRRSVLPSLLLASGTTTAGLVGLGLAGFPGFREMAVFACAGIVGAFATTLVLSSALGPGGGASEPQRRAAVRLSRWFEGARGRWGVAWGVLVGLVGAGALGLTRVRFRDDLSALNVPTPELLAEDARVRARLGESDGGRLVVALGQDLETALERSERAGRALDGLVAEGALGGYQSVEPWLRSAKLQQRNVAALRSVPRVAERTLRALEEAGFVPELFEPFTKELAALTAGTSRSVQPLTWSDLRGGPLEAIVAPFLVEDVPLEERNEKVSEPSTALVTRLRDVRRPEDVARVLEDLEGVHYFDQRAALDALYRDGRRQSVRLLGVAALLIAVVAGLRYRSVRQAAGVVLPSWCGGALTLGLLSLAGVELNLLHMVGLLLVLGMGIDYGIFLVDAERTRATPAALLGIALACCSTLLSFGLLAISTMPALRALGQTVAVGVCANVLLAPLFSIALGRSGRGAGEPGEVLREASRERVEAP